MPTIDCGRWNGRRNRLPHLAGSIVWRSRWGRRFRLPVEADFHRPSKSRKRLSTSYSLRTTIIPADRVSSERALSAKQVTDFLILIQQSKLRGVVSNKRAGEQAPAAQAERR